MKSRFEVLQSPADRRALAVFRSSGAIGVVLTLFVVSSFFPLPHDSRGPTRGDLFAMEIGDAGAVSIESEPEITRSAPQWTATFAGTDEFAFPGGYAAEPVGY